MVGQFDNGSALAPTESYANDSATVNIPIRYRGEVYLIVVADGNNNVDEYPSEANNLRALRFTVDPVPFGDLLKLLTALKSSQVGQIWLYVV